MKDMFFKFILWCVLMVTISAIAIIVLYRLALIITICLALLLLGAIVGIPTAMVLRSKWRSTMKEYEAKEYLNQHRR